MRPSASVAALVTLMSVASTAAAPIRVDPSHVVSRVGNHPLGRSVLPVPDSKVYPDTCECTPISTEDIKSTAIGIDDKAEDMSKTLQDEAQVPDAHAHVEIDATKGGDKTTEPQPQPQPQPLADEPKGHTDDCLDPTKLQTDTCVTTSIKDGIDAIHYVTYTTGDNAKAMPGTALDRVLSVDDKSMDVVHSVEDTHIVPNDNVNVGSDTLKLAGEPCETTAAKAVVEGVNPIKAL